MSILRTTTSCRGAVVPGGSNGEEEWIAARSSGRDSQRRCFALCRPFGNGGGEGSRRITPNASRHPVGAQAAFRRDVPEALSSSGQLAGSVDAIAGSLRSENG